jgi:hypothetical protein
LEDVSNLFLSPRAGEPQAKEEVRGDFTQQARPQPSRRDTPIVLGPSQTLNQEELVSLLNRSTAVLEEGLQAIDANIPCEIGGPISLLAVDATNQLAIIDLDTSTNDELLLRGICHFDWFVRNVPIVRRMYHGRVINFSSQPRLFLVAPDFSPLVMCVVRRISCHQIICCKYHAVALACGTGLLFERA